VTVHHLYNDVKTNKM